MHCLLLSSNTTSLDMQLSQLFEVGITHSQPKIDSHSFTGTGHSQHQDYSCVCVLRVAVSINYWHSHVVCLKLASHTANLKLTPTHLQVQGTVSVKTTAVCVCTVSINYWHSHVVLIPVSEYATWHSHCPGNNKNVCAQTVNHLTEHDST